MNPNSPFNSMHFKSAKIAGLTADSRDMEQINAYALSPLNPEEIFTFKVSMAGNEIDRDYEVFPRLTLSKLANLFVGKTVVKDHDHRSDNQIARIYATELVESDSMRQTKTGEVFVELVARCYMVKTSANADLIAEIKAGIRKEVSLGCRIGKAICSICGTDNVKTYCAHFGGQKYEGNTCYFSLEDPKDAYELSFVAIPAQQHAGTVKSYGEKPCYQEDKGHEKAVIEAPTENLHTRKGFDEAETRLMINRLVEEAKRLLPKQEESFSNSDSETIDSQEDANVAENAPNTPQNAPNEQENAQNCEGFAPKEPLNGPSETLESVSFENLHTREETTSENENRLTVNHEEEKLERLTVNQESCTQEECCCGAVLDNTSDSNDSQESLSAQKEEEGENSERLMVNQLSDEHHDEEAEKTTENICAEKTCVQEIVVTAAPENQSKVDTEQKAKEAKARLRALELALMICQQTK